MRDGKPQGREPSPWVVRFIGGVRAQGRILDVACGGGRHLRLGLDRGFRMLGIDRDLSAAHDLGEHPDLELITADLEDGGPFPLEGRAFDGVIVTNYLWRPILPAIVAAVALDGVLIYETFGVGNERFGRPANPEFLLKPGELLEAVIPRLRVVAFEHARLENPTRIVQRICAVGLRHPWPIEEVPPVL